MAERVMALLRGINVGRAKRVAMADLRQLLADLGYTDIRTHLNSGNAVFSCAPRAVAGSAKKIQAGIAAELGVECAVQTRTGPQLAAVVSDNPLLKVVTDPAKHLVGFLSEAPAPKVVTELQARDFGADQIRVVGTEAYLWCAGGILESPLSKLAWSKELGVSVTTRNWNTVQKLAELAVPAS
ncbi:MAG: DUF1697 domain-containing protein [Actinomycetota bacterium]|nr:DUF1697 domain-containing protein [Actinomycetota bacterium]